MNLVVGAGLSGATIANRIAEELHENVLLIDSRDHIGGNAYDYELAGICVHKYGAHIFNTGSQEVWDYLSRFTKWYPYMHKVIGCIDGMLLPIPFNLNSIAAAFPAEMAARLTDKLIAQFGYNTKVPILELREGGDADLQFLANYVYEKVFLSYTLKQWGLTPQELDPAVTGRVPVYISRDDRYFQACYQGIPAAGYSKMIEKMLDNPLIELKLGTAFDHSFSYERLFFTGAIDSFFNYRFGELPYRSIRLDLVEYDKEYFQPNSVVNYPCNYDFTRIVEHKYFLDQRTAGTVVSYEYSEAFARGKNERYYPIIKRENQELYDKYADEAKKLPNVHFLGRLGDYKYYNMDQAVLRALELMKSIK
ncbi:MAG: UDP-galactopyranose mutase [Deferribacteraceae bacterium]|jgi:UDP-galactopyranose mutase|nr:UDP-galactopyranose mutase [Deferribacteraceae bacterium]